MIDIGKIDLEGDASRGAWHKLVMPDGTQSDAEILLMGSDAPELEETIAALQKSEGASVMDFMLSVVSKAAIGVRGLGNGGSEVKVEDLPGLFKKHKKWMVEQCFRTVMERVNYLEKPNGS